MYAVAVTPDGRQAVSGSEDNTLKVWDLATGAVSTDPVGVVPKVSRDTPISKASDDTLGYARYASALARFLTHPDTKKIVFTTRLAPNARVKRIRRAAEVVVLPRRTVSPALVLDDLERRGVRKVLLEGGGTIHFSFLKEDLVDDIYVTLTPRLIGGAGAPSLLDGKGFLKDDHKKLKLISERRVGDELFLKYRVR